MDLLTPLSIHVPEGYAYPMLVGVASFFLGRVLGAKVGMARRKYNVEYPVMYTNDPAKVVFDCIQRGHQHYLEVWPDFSILLVVGSVFFPKVNATLGALFLLSQYHYAILYASGKPKDRAGSNWGYFPFLGMLLLSVYTIAKTALQF